MITLRQSQMQKKQGEIPVSQQLVDRDPSGFFVKRRVSNRHSSKIMNLVQLQRAVGNQILKQVSIRPQGLPNMQAKQPKICGRPSTKIEGFPETYINSIDVDLTSPNHDVTLSWTGPNATNGETGPFHSSPGAGRCDLNCDNEADSQRNNSKCTPKGSRQVEGYACSLSGDHRAKNVTFFDRTRGVAFHYFQTVPAYPASHGCVRLAELRIAQLIHDNTLKDRTTVTVHGTWTRGVNKRGRPACY